MWIVMSQHTSTAVKKEGFFAGTSRHVQPPHQTHDHAAAYTGGDAMPGPGAIVGVCEDMCPAAERERREHLHDIQIFERVDINDSGRTSAELAVRRFARTVRVPETCRGLRAGQAAPLNACAVRVARLPH